MDERKAREMSFHDTRFQRDGGFERPADRFYKIAYRSQDGFLNKVLTECHGKRILEIGSGQGDNSFALARAGALVTGIDISPVAVENATATAAQLSLHDVTFCVMDAETMDFPNGHFDIVCGTGILHHLELRAALSEIARVLAPGGRAVFVEPLGHNPFINVYRRLTPAQRTRDEHPLTQNDIAFLKTYFQEVDAEYFSLTSLLAAPLAGAHYVRNIVDALDALDRRLFLALPTLRRFAWSTVLEMRRPVAAARRYAAADLQSTSPNL